VSSDARKHIQSHGLGGVQQRHYDKYHYMPEKLAALESLLANIKEFIHPPQEACSRPNEKFSDLPGSDAPQVPSKLMPEMQRLLSRLGFDHPSG
jgi:hypothetical protein